MPELYFSLAFLPLLSFRCLSTVCPSSHWQDACVPLLVPETQWLRNSKIRRFGSDPVSSLAQTFAVNWSGGSGIQTELCGLELECHGKMFPPLFSCFFSLYIFFALMVWAIHFCAWAVLWKELYRTWQSGLEVRIPVKQCTPTGSLLDH